MKRWKEIAHENMDENKGIYSDKIDFKTKTIIKEKEGYYIMIKGLIHQGNITFMSMCMHPPQKYQNM